MFTIIGERINMTRKRIREEVLNRNSIFITSEAVTQTEAGATHIDINAGGDPAREIDDMRWLTEVISQATQLPLVFDSTNPQAIEEGLKICNRPGTIINSITGEEKRLTELLPIVKKYNTGVVALTMDDRGLPEDYYRRMEIVKQLVKIFDQERILLERVYFDPLVKPAATTPGEARFILETITTIRKEYPETHIIVGLSNISFGLPLRNNLNRAFLSMVIAAGCDGVIMDPTEHGMMSTLFSAKAVIGLDEYGLEYISKHREGKL